MSVPINNAFAGKMYTSKTTMYCLAHQTFDGIEWKVATCIERPPLHKDQFQIDTIHLCKCIKQLPSPKNLALR